MNKRILKLAVPSILANITVPLVGMVDIGVVGRLGSTASIGAIAIGTMLFDVLYWNFGFLRIGTGGLTAQAYGKRDFSKSIRHLSQGLATALGISFFLFSIQYLFVELVFLIVDCSPEVELFARQYYFIRIWAAPATLCLFVFKGWFIGMQNTISPMIIDITVNVLNLVLSIFLVLHTSLGFIGVAWGTLIAQYVGFFLSIILLLIYYKKLFKYIDLKSHIRWKEMKGMLRMNSDLFIRSLCFMMIYAGFTSFAANYGDTQLAVSSIMMKIVMLFSYFVDGFAYAGEALVGKYTGQKNNPMLKKSVKFLFQWVLVIGLACTLIYAVWGEGMVKLMTTNSNVIESSKSFIKWLIIMPIIGSAAFMWDGVFVGATQSKAIRNCMLWACLAFYIVFLISKNLLGIQSLWYAYMAHLVVRTLYLSLVAKKRIFIY